MTSNDAESTEKMKRTFGLEEARRVTHDDVEGIDEELEEMPEEKIRELFRAAYIKIAYCDSCSEKTWLIGPMGHNSTDECHNCGEEYRVVG